MESTERADVTGWLAVILMTAKTCYSTVAVAELHGGHDLYCMVAVASVLHGAHGLYCMVAVTCTAWWP